MKEPDERPVPGPRPEDPPEAVPPFTSGAPAPEALDSHDAVDAFLLGRLTGVRLLQVGAKRIVRGRFAGTREHLRAFEAALRGFPVDAFFERVGEWTVVTVSRPRTPAVPPDWPRNLLLFLLTLFTTAWGGAFWNGVDPFAGSSLADPDWGGIAAGLGIGLPFALSLLAILTAHEFGHYLAARHYGLDTTLPFYIPVPPFLSPVGTLGAVIRMRTPLYDRRILMDVGAAGPVAGIVVALPILVWGILHAPLVPGSAGPGLYFNEPLLFTGLELLLRPDIPPAGDIQATSPVLAGWLGLFVTALNLLPVGQLDGGHVSYALLGRGQHRLGTIAFAALAALGFLWMGWWLWVAVILLVLRVKHPPLLDPELPLGAPRKVVGWLTLALFVLCFHPVPFEVR